MKKHICFESIDCKRLQYVQVSNSWVCLRDFFDIDDVSWCVKCKRRKTENYRRVIKGGIN